MNGVHRTRMETRRVSTSAVDASTLAVDAPFLAVVGVRSFSGEFALKHYTACPLHAVPALSTVLMAWALVACLCLTARAQITPARMARTPDIHGDRIVFSVEGDLWLGSLSAGTAVRITAAEATE